MGSTLNSWTRLLIAYFRSGWAFLIPYLAVYLLYAWLKWPVNPATGEEGLVKGISESAQSLDPSLSYSITPPPLLHIYWFLHALHLTLAGVALHAWWRKSSISRSSTSAFWPVLPWFLLALVFLLPGGHWEFPSDPWQHYMRINDWNLYADVGSNSGWHKSSYFFPYSLVGALPAIQQLMWLNYYSAGIGLLLCWQYYRLARDLDLTAGPAFAFILLQTLFFGNSVFSFYRYYCVGSTALAQIAAVSLIRLGFSGFAMRPVAQKARSDILHVALSGACLCLLIAFNHVQAFGLAFLGLLAVAVWRIEKWKRTSGWYLLAGLMLVGMATVHWWPLSPLVRENFRTALWLTPWYGFNLLSPGAPATVKMMQILGVFGVLNFGAATLLLRRNHPVGWLTVMPLLALSMPVFAVPLAEALSRRPLADIDIFHRMFLGIPAGLALVALAANWCREHTHADAFSTTSRWAPIVIPAVSPFGTIVLLLVVLLTVPASAPFYNRFWHVLARPPNDLSVNHLVKTFSLLERTTFKTELAGHFVTTQGIGFVATAAGIRLVTFNTRLASSSGNSSPAFAADQVSQFLRRNSHEHDLTLFVPSARDLFSPISQAGYLSGHWLAQDVALEHATGPETAALALRLDATRTLGGCGEYYHLRR